MEKMTPKQMAMSADFTKMNVGELKKTVCLIEAMIKTAPKEDDDRILAKLHAKITFPLLLLARATNVDYKQSIELGKIKKAMAEIRENVDALLDFAQLMYPKNTEAEESGVKKIHRIS